MILLINTSYPGLLLKFLEPAVGNDSHWLLCYRATAHGWGVRSFHRRCDGKQTTVTIIKNGEYVFGGYTDIPWGKSLVCSFFCCLKSLLSVIAGSSPNIPNMHLILPPLYGTELIWTISSVHIFTILGGLYPISSSFQEFIGMVTLVIATKASLREQTSSQEFFDNKVLPDVSPPKNKPACVFLYDIFRGPE